MTIKKLTAHPHAQAHVEISENGEVHLFSYTTLVASIVNDWLQVYGLYSMTTRKHIGAFCREYANCEYQLAKKIYDDGMIYHISTSEVKEV